MHRFDAAQIRQDNLGGGNALPRELHGWLSYAEPFQKVEEQLGSSLCLIFMDCMPGLRIAESHSGAGAAPPGCKQSCLSGWLATKTAFMA